MLFAADLPSNVRISCAPGECSEDDLAALDAASKLLDGATDDQLADWSISGAINPDGTEDEARAPLERRDGDSEEDIAAKIGRIQHCAEGQCSDKEREEASPSLFYSAGFAFGGMYE